MDIENLSRFRNKLEIAAFARGFISARYLEMKRQENDEWHAFSEDIDINFYTIGREIRAFAYEVKDGYIDSDTEELIYTHKITHPTKP